MAVDLARAFGKGLHVVHALDFSPVGAGAAEVAEPGQLFDIVYTAALARIEEFADSIDVPVGIDVVAEAPVPAICAAAEERKAALVVIGTHGRSGVGRALLGSVAERTLRHAPCSVLVARSG